MQRFGLIGHPLGHSFSKDYFTEKFRREGLADHRYDLFDLEDIHQLPGLLQETKDLRGLNVTLPYKRSIVPFLTRVDALAAAVGAVNTISVSEEGLVGHNTDVFGFWQLVEPVVTLLRDPGSNIRPRALVLGSGGASRAVAYVLRDLGIRFRVVSRDREHGDLTWSMIDPTVIGVCRLIINTTPLGMHPLVDGAPELPYEALTSRHVLIDLVYNPARTRFLQLGEEQGARAIGGLGMLHAQAEESWRIWHS